MNLKIECIFHREPEHREVREALRLSLQGFHYYSPRFHHLILNPIHNKFKKAGFKKLKNGFYFKYSEFKSYLSKTELNVLICLVQGSSSKEIGEILSIAEEWVDTLLISIYKKLHVKDSVHAVVSLAQKGWLKGEDYDWK